MFKFIKIFFFIISPLGIFAFGLQIYHSLSSASFISTEYTMTVYGFFAGSILWLVLGRFLQFFHVLEHELTHLLFGILFLRKPKAISASDQGGCTELYGGNFIITLAPYFFPTLSFLLLIFFPFLDERFYNYFFIALGCFTGYHFISNIQEFKFSQPDIQEAGIIFSPIFCLFGSIVTLGFILGFLDDGFKGGNDFFVAGFNQSTNTIVYLYEQARVLTGKLQWLL